MVESENTSEYKLSSYNSAGNLIKRLDNLWEAAHKDVRSGNYLDWNILLDRLWLEISGDLKENAPEHKEMDKFDEQIVKLIPLSSGNSSGFNGMDEKTINKLSKQYLVLRKKEKFIKRMEGKLGLGKAYADEFEDDWD